MAPLPDYVTGTITLTNGSPNFTGDGTGWLAAGFREGDTILGIEDNEGVVYVIESITDNDAGTLTQDWQGATGTYAYRMRYLSDGQRVTAQARQLIELLGNGNLQAVAGLPGTPQTLMMFTGPGAMVEVPRTDLVSGANYDVQVDTLVERAAYDGSDEGFAVLVADTGDGRAAIYSKLSNAVGDWSAPAYVTGPFTDVTVGSVTELGYGEPPSITGTSGPGTLELDFGLPGGPALSVGAVTRGDADVTSTPVAGGFELDFTIPSQVAQGDYSGATAYVKGDVVQYLGSSWIALQATTGNTPPALPTTSNTYWQLLARAGADGAGTVTTVVAGGGIDVDSTDPTEPIISGVLFDEDAQGQVPGPTEEDILAGRVLKADGTWGDSGGSVDSLFLDDLTGDFDANEKAQARANIGITKWNNRFLGEIIYVDTSLTGVEIPPVDAGFIELTAGLDGSGQYNEGKLTGEVISGSGATLIATAVIDDAGSPMDGQTISLINSEERVTYAGERSKSGDVFNDQAQKITGSLTQGNGAMYGRQDITTAGAISLTGKMQNLSTTGSSAVGYDVDFDSANSPSARTGDRTRAKGQFMVAFLKYKDVV